MPFTNPVYPAVGIPTRRSFAQVIIDDLLYLFGLSSSAKGFGIINGSFEQNTGANTAPSNWDLTLAAGNSCLIEVLAAGVRHGKQSFKMTTPGNVPGGVGIVTADFYEIGEGQCITLSWFMRSTVAGVRNQVLVTWYDNLKSLLSTSTLYDSTANPTVWTAFNTGGQAPASARYFKVQLLGVNNALAGSTWFDGVTYQVSVQRIFVFSTPGTYTWYPTITGYADVELLAGGASGGAGGNSTGGGGGGAGECVQGLYPVTAGVPVTVVVGAGGGNQYLGGQDGISGGDSWFGVNTQKALGGLYGKGGPAGAAGGLGGTHNYVDFAVRFAFNGNTGGAGTFTGNKGGDGGAPPTGMKVGTPGIGGPNSATPGTNAAGFAAGGGGGGGGAGWASGAGAPGRVIIRI